MPSTSSTVPASQPTTSALPSCTEALAKPPGDAAAIDAVKRAAADANADGIGDRVSGVKGLGTVVSAAGRDGDGLAGRPDRRPARRGDGDGGRHRRARRRGDRLDALPPLSPGDKVAFAATPGDDGSYQLIYLGVHIPERPAPAPTSEPVDPAVKAARAGVPDSAVKAMGEVLAAQPGAVTLHVTDGDLAAQDITVTTGPDTLYTTADQKCADPVLSAGEVVGAILVHEADGSYTALEVALSVPPAVRAAGSP